MTIGEILRHLEVRGLEQKYPRAACAFDAAFEPDAIGSAGAGRGENVAETQRALMTELDPGAGAGAWEMKPGR